METILDSKTCTEDTESSQSIKVKAASAPIVPIVVTEKEILKTQISAPSYLFSLKVKVTSLFVINILLVIEFSDRSSNHILINVSFEDT